MKRRDYYITPEANRVMKWFWKIAGGDAYILERATYSDQIKYFTLGGIVLATGLMAGLAGGYAFYTIFSPKGAAIVNDIDIPTVMLSIAFGILWGLMIFNIDRFIVTSTGKGDGTEKITKEEFKGAIPRIIMGMIIAITISKPIEIRMFQAEINNKLYEKQLVQQKDFEEKAAKIFEDRLNLIDQELKEIDLKRKDINQRIVEAERNMQDNLMGKVPGIPAGNGRLTQAIQGQINVLKIELESFDRANEERIVSAEKSKKEILEEKEKVLKSNDVVVKGLDGLLERIKLAHEVAGFWVTLFITLLFMSIELTPIFFKLMLTKTPYDYLAENRDDLIQAENGIEIRYDYYKDKEGVERHLVINHEAERLLYEKKAVTEIQKILTDYAIEKYLEREKKNIDENLDSYINKINPDETEIS